MATRERNQVTQSMISTVSEAFEFQDFLGEKTTLKDRVPKKKADLSQKIVHFSREVDDLPPASNPLQTYKPQESFERKNTFEDYMSNTFSQSTGSYQTPPSYTSYSPYDPVKSTSYQYTPPSYSTQSNTYSQSSYNSYNTQPTYFDSKSKNQMVHSASGKLSFGQKTDLNGNKNKGRVSYENIRSNNQKYPISYGSIENSGYQYNKATPSYYNNDQNYKPINSSRSNYSDKVQTKPTSYYPTNTGNFGVALSYQNQRFPVNYENQKPSVSKSFQINSQPFGKQKTKGYDYYGEYAKDFTSPDILAIMQKRKDITQGKPTSRV